MITKDLIEKNKKKLLAEQKNLRKLLENRGTLEGRGEFPGEYKPKFPSFGDDSDENAGEIESYETNLSLSKDLEKKLSKVEAALKRIEQGTYGKCIEGDVIEEKRLEVLPEAETCLKHADSESK